MKTVPKHIKEKVARMNRLMQQLVDLNIEVETWMEKAGIENAFDFTDGYRDDRGYGIMFPYSFVNDIEGAINGEVE